MGVRRLGRRLASSRGAGGEGCARRRGIRHLHRRAEACYKLTSETTEGPYYIDADKLRQDITEDKEGIPLTLRIKVIDAETCKPVAERGRGHLALRRAGPLLGLRGLVGRRRWGGTPPTGRPPGTPTDSRPAPRPVSGRPAAPAGHQEPTDDERYLRGTWRTDRQGFVTFKTVFPGWYRGRCVHIHTKVHVGGEWTDAGYEGGHTCHTGQLFFDEESVLLSAEVEPYSTNTTERTTLDEDTIYDSGAEGGLLKLKYKKSASPRAFSPRSRWASSRTRRTTAPADPRLT